MAIEYGLTDAGFVLKTFEVIRAEMNESVWEAFGRSLDLSDRTPLGQLIAIFAEREAALWEGLAVAHAALDPDAATGTGLVNLCSISGTIQEGAKPSKVLLHLTGTTSTSVPAGNQVSVDATSEVFQTLVAATLLAATAWATTTAYTEGDIVSNDSNIYVCDVAGTSAGSGGPTGEGTGITDNTVIWRFVGDGLAFATVLADSVNTGPIAANAYAITTQETLEAGWDSVQNLTDATLGTNLELDPPLRIRREEELTRAGSSPADALRVDILDVAGVTAVTVFNNTSDTIDADGVPPHSVEILVQGGVDQDIFDKIRLSKGAATGTHGTESGTSEDSQGTAVPIKFSRPVEVLIYSDITLEYDDDSYPADGDTQSEAAVVAWGDLQATGKDTVSSAIKGSIFAAVAGVLDVSLAYIGTSASPVSEATIAVGTRELAVYDTSRITITSAPGTP